MILAGPFQWEHSGTWCFSYPMRLNCWLCYQVNGSVQKLESGAALCGRLLLTFLSINSFCPNFGLFILSEAKWFFNKRQWMETKYSWNAGTKTNGSSFKTNTEGRRAQLRRPKKKNTLRAATNQLWTCATYLQVVSDCTMVFCLLMEIWEKDSLLM